MRFDFITRDFSLKLFSLGVAVLFFLFVSVESATPIDVTFNIEYKLASDIMITGVAPERLHATLQGPWATFRSYATEDVETLVVDLSTAPPGRLRHVVDLSRLKVPAGMKVVSIRPSELELTLDRRVERMVPVSADIPTRPAFGFTILDVRVDPPRVPVVGPVTRMGEVEFITTRMIDVSGREESLSIEVDLRAPPLPLKLSQSRVRVLVEIGEEFVQRSFRDVPVQVENAPRGTTVEPEVVTIILKGPRRVVDNMPREDVVVFVDAQLEIGDGRRSIEKAVELRTDLPERVHVIAPVPKVRLEVPASPRRRRRH